MSLIVEPTGAGLTLRNAAGEPVAAFALFQTDKAAVLVCTGNWPEEVHLDAAALEHLTETFGRSYRMTLFPADYERPCVPRIAATMP